MNRVGFEPTITDVLDLSANLHYMKISICDINGALPLCYLFMGVEVGGLITATPVANVTCYSSLLFYITIFCGKCQYFIVLFKIKMLG